MKIGDTRLDLMQEPATLFHILPLHLDWKNSSAQNKHAFTTIFLSSVLRGKYARRACQAVAYKHFRRCLLATGPGTLSFTPIGFTFIYHYLSEQSPQYTHRTSCIHKNLTHTQIYKNRDPDSTQVSGEKWARQIFFKCFYD